MIAYAATTRDVTITVRPIYLDASSDFMEMQFAFAYAVCIENAGREDVQVIRRRWTIQENNGRTQDMEGEGVIGKKPVIPPGGIHQYTSSCVISSFDGTMEGTYLMQREDGERFRATIPRFHLHAAAN